jgi:hypothetical protein
MSHLPLEAYYPTLSEAIRVDFEANADGIYLAKRSLGLPIPLYEIRHVDHSTCRPSLKQLSINDKFPAVDPSEYAHKQLKTLEVQPEVPKKQVLIPKEGYDEALLYLKEFNVDLDEVLEFFYTKRALRSNNRKIIHVLQTKQKKLRELDGSLKPFDQLRRGIDRLGELIETQKLELNKKVDEALQAFNMGR